MMSGAAVTASWPEQRCAYEEYFFFAALLLSAALAWWFGDGLRNQLGIQQGKAVIGPR